MVLKTNRLTRLRNQFLFINEEVKFSLLFNTKESSVRETLQFFVINEIENKNYFEMNLNLPSILESDDLSSRFFSDS